MRVETVERGRVRGWRSSVKSGPRGGGEGVCEGVLEERERIESKGARRVGELRGCSAAKGCLEERERPAREMEVGVLLLSLKEGDGNCFEMCLDSTSLTMSRQSVIAPIPADRNEDV
jgi:hypothetical protein